MNWPSFNVTMTQGIGRPEEKEMREQLVNGAVRTYTTFMDCLPSYMGIVHATPKVTIVTSKITEHR